MGAGVEPGRRRRTNIHQDQRPAGLDPFEAAMPRALQGPPGGIGLGQRGVDQDRLALPGPVEQGETTIAVAKEPDRRGHAVNGVLQGLRHFGPGGAHDGAQVDQMAQQIEVDCRAALHMAAIGQDLRLQRLGQQLLRRLDAGIRTRQAQHAVEQPLQRDQQRRSVQTPRKGPRQMPGLARQAGEGPRPEPVIGAGAVEIVGAEPAGDPEPEHIRTPDQRVPAVMPIDPRANQHTGLPPGGVAADGAQVAQPVEAVQIRQESLAHSDRLPQRNVGDQGPPGEPVFAGAQRGTPLGVAGPRIGRHHFQSGRAATA